MLHIPELDLVLFLCSPSVLNLDDLKRRGLFLSDIPLHDATRDLVLLSEQFEAEYQLTKNLEILTDKLQQTYRELEKEKEKTDRLLYSVLPPSVANELRHSRPVPAKKYESVTILFSGIVGFTTFCAKNSDAKGAIKIVNLLNSIYTTFDVLTDPRKNPNVYKVSISQTLVSFEPLAQLLDYESCPSTSKVSGVRSKKKKKKKKKKNSRVFKSPEDLFEEDG